MNRSRRIYKLAVILTFGVAASYFHRVGHLLADDLDDAFPRLPALHAHLLRASRLHHRLNEVGWECGEVCAFVWLRGDCPDGTAVTLPIRAEYPRTSRKAFVADGGSG